LREQIGPRSRVSVIGPWFGGGSCRSKQGYPLRPALVFPIEHRL
jgi:hypothetical protein